MKRNQDSHEGMFAANQLLSHVAAFVGIEMVITPQAELFQLKQEELGFPNMLALYLASFAGAALLLTFLSWFMGLFRKKATRLQQEQETLPEALAQQPAFPRPGDEAHEQEPHWVLETEEAEEECAAIIMSLMTRQLILFGILGRVPTKKGDFGRHERADFGFLFGAIVLTMVLLMVTTKAYFSCPETSWFKHKLVFLKHYLAFTVGWLFLSLSRWSVQMVVMDKTLMFITNAVGLSVPLVLMIILIDFLCDEGWMSENSAMIFISCAALCIGLSWECAFACAIDTINKVTGSSIVSNVTVEMGLCLGLCLLLLPGWKAFVVPKAASPLPPRVTTRATSEVLRISESAVSDKGH